MKSTHCSFGILQGTKLSNKAFQDKEVQCGAWVCVDKVIPQLRDTRDAQETGRELEKENDRQNILGDGMYNFSLPGHSRLNYFLLPSWVA